MSSSVFFKFKSQREPTRVPFDGTGISVFELKRTIIEVNRLGDGTDFDLAIYNEDTNEEYDDDTTIIPRSTSIIARRLPPFKPGKGGAARYVSGKMPVKALSTSRSDKPISKPAVQGRISETDSSSATKEPQTEEEKIAAMFKAGAEQWEKQQQEMANATPVYRNGGPKTKPNVNVPSHAPPPGYICYRCGEKGHWIQECPTNNDPNFDGRPRVKRTTGIPRSFLKTIEKPQALSNDGLTDSSQQPSSVMVNAEGEFVVAEPDKASWEQFQAKTKLSAVAQAAAETGSKELQERGLECSIDKKLFIDPTKTPCCKKVYCNDCIANALIERDLKCPGCESEGILLDDLVPDEETATKVKKYLDEKDEKKEKAGTPPVKSQGFKSPPSLVQQTRTPSPSGTSTASGSGNSKKRSAEEPLDNERAPKAAAMQRVTSQPKSMSPQIKPHQPITNQVNGALQNTASAQLPMLGSDFFNQNIGAMGMPNVNTNMAMGMGMGFGPMMGTNMNMPSIPALNGYGAKMAGFPNMNTMGFLPQQQAMYGNGYGPQMMGNGFGSFGQNGAFPMTGGAVSVGAGMGPNMNMFNSVNSMNPMMGFPQSQQPGFGGPPPIEEDNAYFRKPVNPHRHQARQRRVRPSDYREL